MFLTLGAIHIASLAFAEAFMSEQEALEILFPRAAWTEEVKTLDGAAREELARSTRLRFGENSYRFHVARADGRVAGYALTLDEIGKSEPITFTVGIDANGKVTDVILLVFRESRGAEVRDKRFLRQFHGKTRRDPLQVNRDILNYSGATLSSQALARGVRKALVLLGYFYHPDTDSRAELGSKAWPRPREGAGPPAPAGLGGAAETVPRAHYFEARYLMGTVCEVELYASDRRQARAAANAAFEAMHEVDRRMSIYRPASELSRLNHFAAGPRAGEPIHVSRELFQVLELAQKISEASDGAFDITVAPLLRAWGFLPPVRHPDGPAEGIPSAPLPRVVGYRHMRLDAASLTVTFTTQGVELDLGGIAKGYAVDQAVEALRARGIRSARVGTGGSTLYALGAPPDSPRGWKLVLTGGKTLTLRDAAVSSSGHSEKFVEVGGRRYSHIFDPRRGKPVSTEVTSVSVLATTAMESDALTKPFFMLSRSKQAKLLQSFPRCRVWVGHGQRIRALAPSRG